MKETSQLTCSTNQWTGFYVITASVMKELRNLMRNSKKVGGDKSILWNRIGVIFPELVYV